MATPKSRSNAAASSKSPAKSKTPAAKAPDGRLQTARRASEQLKQVSEPTRLQVVHLLSRGELHVGGLCNELGQSQPAVSHHLALLRHGGIIVPRRDGKNNIYKLTDSGEKLSKIVKLMVEK